MLDYDVLLELEVGNNILCSWNLPDHLNTKSYQSVKWVQKKTRKKQDKMLSIQAVAQFLHPGKNIYKGNNALQQQHFENHLVFGWGFFSPSSVNHRLISVCGHRDNSSKWQYRIKNKNQDKHIRIALWHQKAVALSGSLSFLRAQHQKLQLSSGPGGKGNATISPQDFLLSPSRSIF